MTEYHNPSLPLKVYNIFLILVCTYKKAFDLVYGKIWGPYLSIVHIMEAKYFQDIPFIGYRQENMKGSMVKFITKQTGGFIGSNAFSMGIGPAKVV